MDLNQYLLALKARKKAFVTVAAVTVFTAIVVALLLPKRYDATATVLIDARDIITIKYASNDAKKAADVANAFAKAYLDVALELRTEPSREAGQWFDEQLKSLRTDLTGAQTKLAAYQKEKGVVGVEERMDVEISRMNEISGELTRQRAATMDAQTRYKQSQDLIAGGVSLEAFPEVLANGYVITVKSALQAAEQRLQEQSEVLGQNHPQYQRTAAEVQS